MRIGWIKQGNGLFALNGRKLTQENEDIRDTFSPGLPKAQREIFKEDQY